MSAKVTVKYTCDPFKTDIFGDVQITARQLREMLKGIPDTAKLNLNITTWESGISGTRPAYDVRISAKETK
jgi:hypothetical protein